MERRKLQKGAAAIRGRSFRLYFFLLKVVTVAKYARQNYNVWNEEDTHQHHAPLLSTITASDTTPTPVARRTVAETTAPCRSASH